MTHTMYGLKMSSIRIAQISGYALFLIVILLLSDKYINPTPVVNVNEIRIYTDGTAMYDRTILVSGVPVIWTGRIDLPNETKPICEDTGVTVFSQQTRSKARTSINALIRAKCGDILPKGAVFSFSYIPTDSRYSSTIYRGIVEDPPILETQAEKE